MVAGITGLGAIFASADSLDPTLRFFGEMVIACAVLAWMLMGETGHNRSPLLEYLGNASYAIYLSHMFVIAGVLGLVSRLVSINSGVLMTGLCLACAALAVLVGVVVHEKIEKPLLALFRRRSRRAPLVLRDA